MRSVGRLARAGAGTDQSQRTRGLAAARRAGGSGPADAGGRRARRRRFTAELGHVLFRARAQAGGYARKGGC